MSDPEDFTIAWICALTTEFVAAIALLDEEYQDVYAVAKRDDNNYKLGRCGQHRVVIAVLPGGEYGLVSAAVVARDIVHTFKNLRFGLMVGIGGGAPSKKYPIRLGDVVVSQPDNGRGGVLQYDFGKAIQEREFLQTGHLDQPPRVLRTATARLNGDHELNGHRIQESIEAALERRPRLRKKYGRPGTQTDLLHQADVIHPYDIEGSCADLCSSDPAATVFREERSVEDDDPTIFYGLIASANSLMEDATIRDNLTQKHGVLCFEMEAAGLMNNFPCLVIRGICDYADSHKNKAWQGYAAMTSAAYAKELLLRIAQEDVQSSRKLTELIEGIQTDVESIRDNTKVIADYNLKQAELSARSQHNSCLQVFKTSTYEAFKERNPPRIEGTCLWAFNHPTYNRWLENSKSDLLWISADPGCGKSVLAKALVDDSEFSVASQAIVCHFFFKDNEDQDSLTTALCALLHQLFSAQPLLLSYAIKDWENTGDKLRSEANTLWRILESAATDSKAGQIVCVLDALDECREQDRQRLINFLCGFYNSKLCSSSKGGALKFVVTGRPYADQEQRFSKVSEIRLRGEDENEKLRQEINLVIRYRLRELEMEMSLSESTWWRLKKKLLEMEHRTYLWFYLAIEDIRETYRNSLRPNEDVVETVPSSVYNAYEKILAKVTAQQRDLVRQVLAIILGARRPFSLGELCYALGIATSEETDDIEKVVIRRDLSSWLRSSCGLFVYISDAKVYLIHQTAKDFLLDRKGFLNYSWSGSLEVTAINNLLGRTCIYALCSKDFQTYDPGQNEFPCVTNDLRHEKHTFLSYCAEYWTSHLQEAYDNLCNVIRDRINVLHNVNGIAFRGWFGVMWKALFPYEGVPMMTQIRLCAFTGHHYLLEQTLSYADSRLEECDEDRRNALYWGSYFGFLFTTRVLINKGADVNTQSGYRGSALRAASHGGHKEIVRLLIDNGADVNAHGPKYANALQAASYKGYEEIARILIDKGADVHTKDSYHGNALSIASSGGYEETVRLLIDKGANVNAQDGHYSSALYIAAYEGYKKVTRLLLNNGADVNIQGGRYGNALQAASFEGHEEIVRVLITNGANVNAQGGYHGNALCAALDRGHEKMTRLLVDKGADINAKDSYDVNALSIASSRGYGEITRLLIDKSADISAKDGYGRTALQAASFEGHEEIVRLLIDKGADIDAQGGYHSNALQAASFEGHEEIVRVLITNGANVNAQGGYHGNALCAASDRGREKIVRLLVDNSVDVNAHGGNYGNALETASFGGHEEIVRVLITNGADANAQGGYYGNALQAASYIGHEGIARLLIDNSADVNARGGYHGNALETASFRGYEELARLLINSGADVNAQGSFFGYAL